MPSDPSPEPIDVVRIRLSQGAGATAIVSEFRLANRILAAWAAQASGECGVDYEVTFFDGLRLAGHHALLRKGKAHVSLSRVVRRLFRERAGAGPAGYLVDG